MITLRHTLLALAFCFLPLSAHAATLNVPAQYATIQAGVNAAVNGDTVLVADGTYTGNGNRDIDFNGKNITVASQHGSATTIIDCQGTSAHPYTGFIFQNGETSAVLRGVTIKNAYGFSYADGAIEVGSTGFGSGQNIIVSIQSCVITGSTGSAIVSGDTSAAQISVINCTFSNNTGSGGGIVNHDTANITGCTFSGNTAFGDGGGVSNKGGMATLTNCTFTNNTAGNTGGAVYNNGTLTVTGCTLTGNTAAISGGGVYNHTVATVTNCVFTGNRVTGQGNGGGFYNAGSVNTVNGTTATLTNCLFFGNTTADGSGGAIYNSSQTATNFNSLVLQFCTLSANTAQGTGAQGSAVENDGALIATNIIIYANNPASGSGLANGRTYRITYSDIEGGFTGTGNINADPLFVNAAGGDFHLRAGSPVIGKGIPVSGVTTDKDGVTRPNPPSIGAYEFVAPTHTFTATHVAAGGGGSGVLLWNSANGAAFVQTVQANGTATRSATFGPYTGASAKAIAVAPDGTTRLLWTNTNGTAAVWSLTGAGNVTSYGTSFGPYAGSTATGMTVTADGRTRLLWTTTAGAAQVWTLDTIGRATAYGPTFGPYTGGAHVSAIGGGADGRIRLLWTNTAGAASVWVLNANAAVTSYGATYGPYTGAAALSVSGGADGKTRLLWKNSANAASVWTLSATGSVLSYGTTYGPYTGASAYDLSVGTDNVTRLLWANTSGQASVWSIAPTNGAVTYSPNLGPF